jgi:hypothetical protein
MRDNTLNTPDLQWMPRIVILLPENVHLPSWATIYNLHSSYNEVDPKIKNIHPVVIPVFLLKVFENDR